MADKGGRRANEHGDDFRDAVAALLIDHGFTELQRITIDPDEQNPLGVFESQRRSTLGQPHRAFITKLNLLHRACLHRKLYAAHFLVLHESWSAPVALMCRTQGGSGSADEKLEYMYRNMWNFPCRSLALLDGFEDGVLARAFDVCRLSRGKIALVFDALGGLRRWMTDGFSIPPQNDQREISA